MKAVLTMGLPGAGKSTVLETKYNLNNFTVVDPDEIKKSHPEYDVKELSVCHEWSKQEAELRIAKVIRDQENVIIDGTGTNVEKMYSRITTLQAAGYEVELLFVKVSLKTAIQRNSERDRVVDEEIIREKFLYIKDAFEILSTAADSSVVVNNE